MERYFYLSISSLFICFASAHSFFYFPYLFINIRFSNWRWQTRYLLFGLEGTRREDGEGEEESRD